MDTLFRSCLAYGKLPRDWKKAVVKPMFKGGASHTPSNYRPVSLTPIICKIFEKFCKEAIENHMQENELWAPEQHGFSVGRSCATNLMVAKEKWSEAIDRGNGVNIVYVDFSKAFDKVPHNRLLHKLWLYGIEGKLLDCIEQFLKERTLQVKVNDTMSNPIPCRSGVPQGSVLGPTLFKVFVNDLPGRLGVESLLFADDLKLWVSLERDDHAEVLQRALEKLNEWGMPLNENKCTVMTRE